MADVWLSAVKAGELTDWSARHVNRTAAAKMWPSRESDQVKANGKREREFPLACLPESAQLRYQDHVGKQTAIVVRSDAILERNSDTADPLRSSPKIELPVRRERGNVPERFRPIVAERMRAIENLIYLGTRGGREQQTQFAALLESESKVQSISTATLRRWLDRYRTRGEAGLAPKLREDEKESRFFKRHPKAAAFCQAKAVNENLSNMLVWLALKREWPALGERGAVPSYNTVLRYLRNKIRPDVKILAREGKREYMRTAVPTIVRDRRGILANEWWVMDHRTHDVFTWNDVFPADILEPRKMHRLWMSLTWDWGSRKIVGVIWAPTPSSRTITASLRMAVAESGLPRNFYWDNGKDYQCVGRVLMDEQLGGILLANGVEITSALPYNARSKPIEPFFQRFAHGFDRKWGAGYCSNKPQLCSSKCRDAQRDHKDFYEGKAHETPLRSDKEFIVAALQEIQEYNEEPNPLLDGRSPNEVFEQQCPPESRRVVERRMLDQLFWQRDSRVVHEGGCVELNKLKYEPTPESFGALAAKWKQEVTIARDPWDLGTAVAFEASTGEFIGELQIQEAVGQSAHGRLSVDGIRAMARRRSAMLRSASLYCAALQNMAEVNGWKSEPDSLLERAGASRTGTDGRDVLSSAPGSLQQMAEPRRLAGGSPFISDAAKEDAALFADLAAEDPEVARTPRWT